MYFLLPLFLPLAHRREIQERKQILLGFEVDKPSKFFIKISNAMESIESDIQNIKAPRLVILSSSMYEKTYLQEFP